MTCRLLTMYFLHVYVLFSILYLNNSYLTKRSISDLVNEEQIASISGETSLANDSYETGLAALSADREEWKGEQSYVDPIEQVDYLSDRSIHNDTRRFMPDYRVVQFPSLLGNQLREIKNLQKRELDEDKTETHVLTKTSIFPNREATWEEWTPWSSCSVSCGKGRNIRWRHCRSYCEEAETEMQEKICQMPACPQKLFGLIKL